MNGNHNGYLVDTNVVIRFLKGVTELFPYFEDMETLFVSSVSVGELMYGAELSAKSTFNRDMYFNFCENMQILTPDAEVGKIYGKIKAFLKKKGHPIPENDIWIAATAMAANLELVTADSDFLGIDGLAVKMI
ncbi:MAG: type II toxin-antitoxin system VapC family toxin [Treponemataceae bacterium]|nr:type II toxin-antitoxin system VapC family toxin [Treponemataceae bacterium]